MTADENDRNAIEQLSATWVAAVNAKDVTALLDMVTDDVVFLPPGFPPLRGRASVEAMYRAFFPQFSRVEQTATIEELEVLGDWAFTWGSETMVLVPPAGTPIQMKSRGFSILKRQPGGAWKFARALTQPQPPLPSAAPPTNR